MSVAEEGGIGGNRETAEKRRETAQEYDAERLKKAKRQRQRQ
jgi:hypothetical protein